MGRHTHTAIKHAKRMPLVASAANAGVDTAILGACRTRVYERLNRIVGRGGLRAAAATLLHLTCCIILEPATRTKQPQPS